MKTSTQRKLDRWEKAALKWAKSYGYGGDVLPQGIQGDGNHCPLACATGFNVSGSYATIRISHPYGLIEDRFMSNIKLPRKVRNFVHAFDNGGYPHLREQAVLKAKKPATQFTTRVNAESAFLRALLEDHDEMKVIA